MRPLPILAQLLPYWGLGILTGRKEGRRLVP